MTARTFDKFVNMLRQLDSKRQNNNQFRKDAIKEANPLTKSISIEEKLLPEEELTRGIWSSWQTTLDNSYVCEPKERKPAKVQTTGKLLFIEPLKSPEKRETAHRRKEARLLNLDEASDLNGLPSGRERDKTDPNATKEPELVGIDKKPNKQTKTPEDLTKSLFDKSSGHIFLVDSWASGCAILPIKRYLAHWSGRKGHKDLRKEKPQT